MVETSISSNGSLVSRLDSRSASLNSIAALAAAGSGNAAIVAEHDGARAVNDRIFVAAGIGLSGEAAGLAASSASARQAASMLQVADGGLKDIGDKLAAMKALVETITTGANPVTSSFDRAVLDRDFLDLRTTIDGIARATEFNGVKILQGDGAGGSFAVAFKVGTGQAPGDTITIAIGSALVADLSAGLATDSLATTAGAATALTNVTKAIDQLNAVRGAVAGFGEAVFIAAENASDIATGLTDFNRQRIAVDVDLDAARFLGQEIARQGGARLSGTGAELLRGVLDRLDRFDRLDASGQPDDSAVDSKPSAPATGAAPAATGSSPPAEQTDNAT
jgi:flagellin